MLSNAHPKSLLVCIIFDVALVCAFRPSELHALKIKQVVFSNSNKKEIIRIVDVTGGNSKKSKIGRESFTILFEISRTSSVETVAS